jgi:hypothetical protein
VTWFCQPCKEAVPSDKLLDHARLMHPDQDAEVELWEDGQPVVYDETVDEDFFSDDAQ